MKTATRALVVLLTTMGLCSFVSASVFNTNLSLGAKNDSVLVLQQFLISQGFLSGTSTNYFGNQTKKAVQAFQKQNGLPATGGWFALTRQKADSILANSKQPVTVSTAMTPTSTPTIVSASSTNPVLGSNTNVVLTVSTTKGGYVLSSENSITCYDDSTCTKTFPMDKRIILRASPKEGYVLSGWSEASCGMFLECPVKLIENTTVYARFKVKGLFDKPMGEISSLNHPNDTCYIPLGRDMCDLRLTWITNSAAYMTLKVGPDEYYLSAIDNDHSSWQTSDIDPEDRSKTESENASGPAYLELSQGVHKISLLWNHNQVLDAVTVEVKCRPDDYWDGTKCWQKGANSLYIFKKNGAVIKSSPEGINCGYSPEKCVAGFSSSTSVTLKAIVTPGYAFDKWVGDCSGSELTCTILMNRQKSVGFKMK